jgi:chromosome segregation ATPase
MRDKSIERFEVVLADKKVPLVTLDNKWYVLFDGDIRTFTLTNLEKKLNKLLRRQGQLYNELKEMEIAKKTLMDKILENMDINPGNSNSSLKARKLDASSKLINDLNNKIANSEKELEELPLEIDKTNKTLLVEGMRICYHALKTNKKNIEEINKWIENVREELKKNVVKKQEIQDETNQMYSYMHDILGFEIVDIFDMYNEAPSKE